jgi:hypothetical protein
MLSLPHNKHMPKAVSAVDGGQQPSPAFSLSLNVTIFAKMPAAALMQVAI